MRSAWSMALLMVALLSCGCTTGVAGMAGEARCLESLTPAFLEAQDELAGLEQAWRAVAIAAPIGPSSAHGGSSPEQWLQKQQQAQEQLKAARDRHRRTVVWFDRVYERVRLRTEEERLRAEVFWSLVPTPALVFYPVVRWNLHAVMWDDKDPDADSDEIQRFCRDLLANELAVRREGTKEEKEREVVEGHLHRRMRDVSYFGAQPK